MFHPKSRYAKLTRYRVVDRRGREVEVVPAAPAHAERLRGYHLRKQNQRLDHLAAKYLHDPTGYWRLCELADAMVPDAIAEASEIAIPEEGE